MIRITEPTVLAGLGLNILAIVVTTIIGVLAYSA
jgi:hypothetical protein